MHATSCSWFTKKGGADFVTVLFVPVKCWTGTEGKGGVVVGGYSCLLSAPALVPLPYFDVSFFMKMKATRIMHTRYCMRHL